MAEHAITLEGHASNARRMGADDLAADMDGAAEHIRNLESALRDLLECLTDSDLFRELEAGCDGEGPVVCAYKALGDEMPDTLKEYLSEDEDNDDQGDDEDGEDDEDWSEVGRSGSPYPED